MIIHTNQRCGQYLKDIKAQLLTDEGLKPRESFSRWTLVQSRNIANTDYFKNRLVTIQRQVKQLVAPLLDPQPTDPSFLICVVLQGSKTTHLAVIMNNQGKIIAYDLFEHKIKLVEAIKRLGVCRTAC